MVYRAHMTNDELMDLAIKELASRKSNTDSYFGTLPYVRWSYLGISCK